MAVIFGLARCATAAFGVLGGILPQRRRLAVRRSATPLPRSGRRRESLDASRQVKQLAEQSALPLRTVALRRSRAALGRGRLLALAPDRGLQVVKAHGAPPPRAAVRRPRRAEALAARQLAHGRAAVAAARRAAVARVPVLARVLRMPVRVFLLAAHRAAVALVLEPLEPQGVQSAEERAQLGR